MKLPVGWLKEWVGIKANVKVQDLAHRLTMSGFEVEGIETSGGDFLLEVNVTPNRGDALSILGMAREVSALYGVPIRKSPQGRRSGPKGSKGPVAVTMSASKECPRYALAVISGVKVGPSPEWLVRRLEQVGVRSINNVVDITNYVLHEMGQPLHAFDRSKIKNNRIQVRLAREGEKIRTLDAREHSLQKSDLVIADAEEPIALAGVMGGAGSEVDAQTTAIALESAFFNPATVRKTARRLGIQTGSSFRFERRVDPEGILPALERAVQMILELAGGVIEGGIIDLCQKTLAPHQPTKISLDPAWVAGRLGGDWKAAEMKRLLEKLKLSVAVRSPRSWQVTVPSHRGDLKSASDLMEEIIRLGGVDRIPVTFPALKSAPIETGETGAAREAEAKRYLNARGFFETIHYSFISPEDVSRFDPKLSREEITLGNPLGLDVSVLRPSLLPSLLKTASHHHRHKMFDIRLFELRKRFSKDVTGKLVERMTLSGIVTGARLDHHWSGSEKSQPSDFYDLKGVLEGLMQDLRWPGPDFVASSLATLHPHRQAILQHEENLLGHCGEIHPEIAERFDLKRTAMVFELNWGILAGLRTGTQKFADFSRLPMVERDVALVLDDAVSAGQVIETIRGQDPVIRSVKVFDVYKGNQIPEGKKSLALSIQLAAEGRTLTDEEIHRIQDKMIEKLKYSFNAEIR